MLYSLQAKRLAVPRWSCRKNIHPISPECHSANSNPESESTGFFAAVFQSGCWGCRASGNHIALFAVLAKSNELSSDSVTSASVSRNSRFPARRFHILKKMEQATRLVSDADTATPERVHLPHHFRRQFAPAVMHDKCQGSLLGVWIVYQSGNGGRNRLLDRLRHTKRVDIGGKIQ